MKNPAIHIGKTKFDLTLEILTILAIIATLCILVYYYSLLPEKLPIYFNWPTKENTGLGSKNLLFISPIISGAIFFGFYLLNKKPWIFNYPTEITKKNAIRSYRNSTQMLRLIALVISLMCFCFTLFSILNGLGNSTNYGIYIYPVFPVLLIIIPIIYMIKMFSEKPN